MEQNQPFDISNFRAPKIDFKKSAGTVALVIMVVLLFSAWFTVEPEEVGVVLRFGEYVRTVNPGLNFKIPLLIERVYKVPVERQLKLEFGFRSINPGIKTTYSRRNFKQESLMLTGDLNAAEVEWIVQFRISDPYKFLFRVRNAEKTFRDINEAVMREVVGDRTVDEVLTVGRQDVASTVTATLQMLCDQYELGVKVDQVVLQDVNPPEKVKPAFNEVNEAQQEREKLINQAKSEYNKVIPKARGEAERAIEGAKGYALERVNQAKGEAAAFNSVFKEYSKSTEVTLARLYLETMNNVMQKVGKKVIIDEKATGILPLFQMEKGAVK